MKALLVDDSKAARFAMRGLLEKQGLEVLIAASGEEALELLQSAHVDIVFMDQSMPGMGGIEATRRIASGEGVSPVPVVLCTGNEGDKLEHMAAEAGAIGVLTKPPKAELLEALLNEFKGKAQAEEAVTAEPAAAEPTIGLEPVAEEAAPTLETEGAPAPATPHVAQIPADQFVTKDQWHDLRAAIDANQLQFQRLESLESVLNKHIDERLAKLQAGLDVDMKGMRDSLKQISEGVAAQVKEQLAVTSGSQRIQLESLRQQVESGLDDMAERENALRKRILDESDATARQLIEKVSEEIKQQAAANAKSMRDDLEKRLAAAEAGAAKAAKTVMPIAIGAAVAALAAIALAVLM